MSLVHDMSVCPYGWALGTPELGETSLTTMKSSTRSTSRATNPSSTSISSRFRAPPLEPQIQIAPGTPCSSQPIPLEANGSTPPAYAYLYDRETMQSHRRIPEIRPTDVDAPGVRACGIARRTAKRTRDYPSLKPTLHLFFPHKPPFFFFNYCAIY